MDLCKSISDTIVTGLLPQFKNELEYAYIVSMVLLAVNSADRSWHASNIFYSFNRALLFVQGCDLVIAICLGDSPVKHLAEMQTLMTVLFVWWLALFSPLDILTKALNVKVGDIKPVALLLVVMTSLRNLVAISDAVSASLDRFPGSLIAVLLGTVAGGGAYAVSGVFGDFARQISSGNETKNAFTAALLITLAKVYFPACTCANVVLTVCILLIIPINISAELNKSLDIFSKPYDLLCQFVNLRDLVAKQKSD